MTLPNRYTTYTCTLPTSDKQIKFRPYTGAEEYKLLTSMELNDVNVLIDNVYEVIKACCLDNIDPKQLNISELSYLFLQIKTRAQATNIVKLQIENDVDCEDEMCPMEMKGSIKLTELPLQFIDDTNNWAKVTSANAPKNTKQIVLAPEFGAQFRQPRLGDGVSIESSIYDIDVQAKCLLSVYDGDKIYDDFTYDEAVDFIIKLDKIQTEAVDNWFSSLPRIRTDCTFSCAKCKKEKIVPIEGISSFFEP